MIQILQIASGVFIAGVGLLGVWFVLEGASDQDSGAATGIAVGSVIGCVGTIAAIAFVAGLWWLAAQFGWSSP